MKKLIVGWLAAVSVTLGIFVSEAISEEAGSLPEYRGVVVEEVGKGSALERAGLQPGDVLYAWKRLASPSANLEPAEGKINSPFDWVWLQSDQAPRGDLHLIGERIGGAILLKIEAGLWEAKTRARMPRDIYATYASGQDLINNNRWQEGVDLWKDAVENARIDGNLKMASWLAIRMAEMLADRKQLNAAHAALKEALAMTQDTRSNAEVLRITGSLYERQEKFDEAASTYILALKYQEREGMSLSAVQVYRSLGRIAWKRDDLETCEYYFVKSLDISRRLAPGSIVEMKALGNMGSLAWKRGNLEKAEAFSLKALEIGQKIAPGSLEVASILDNIGNIYFKQGNPSEALRYNQWAYEIRLGSVPRSLPISNSLVNIGNIFAMQGLLEEAINRHLEALEIREELAPDSLAVAQSLNNLGVLYNNKGDLEAAEAHFTRALAIQSSIAPGSLAVGDAYLNIGVLARSRGDLQLAENHQRKALEIYRSVSPDSAEVSFILNNLGNIFSQRGELEKAREHYKQTLELQSKISPESPGVAKALGNIGAMNISLGNLDLAEGYLKRSLKVLEKLAPRSLDVTDGLNNLGVIARKRGDLKNASALHRQALEIEEELAPGSLALSDSLHNLGILYQDLEEFEEAEIYYGRALEIRRNLSGGSLAEAASLQTLGGLAEERGENQKALEYYNESLRIAELLAPGSWQEAETLGALGSAFHKMGKHGLAEDYYDRSTEILELQIGRMIQSEDVRSGFRSLHGKLYRGATRERVELKKWNDAFDTVESSRGQSFLTLLAERDIVFLQDVSKDIERARLRIAARYDETTREVASLHPQEDAGKLSDLLHEQRMLKVEQEEIAAVIRKVSPRLADLHYPQPLRVDEVQQALDHGTLLLSYNVDEEMTTIFALSRSEGLNVSILSVGEEPLRSQVSRLRILIRESLPGSSLSDGRLRHLHAESRALYDLLLAPFSARIAASERLLILPDGPLHALPFAVLKRVGDAEMKSQYLVEWKPLHIALSATVYSELKRRRRGSQGNTPMQIAAFGDPHYPQSPARVAHDAVAELPAEATDQDHRTAVLPGDAIVRAAAERGALDLQPLPYTRFEVETIASLFPEGTVRTFIGSEALEERIKDLDPRTRILHLAAHGYIDQHLPTSSFVALTIPTSTGLEQDNGLLQVWEIFERVRIDADLVVLSACESGLGQELWSEGLIGLTRAFQYAGARSVVASLWSVADRTTAELMIRFYRHLRSGLPKDEALRVAQIELIRRPIEVTDADGEKVLIDASSPYYWAAFQVFGDWQ